MIDVHIRHRIIVVGILLCVVYGSVQAQENKLLRNIKIEPQEKWRTVFGGEVCIYHFHVTSNESIQGHAGWVLRYENRTIVRGECAFEAGPSKGGLIEIRINVPHVKEGVMMPVQFAVALYQKGEREALASWEETLYIFFKDPFAFKKEWLKGLKIGLFDPEEKTQDALEELGIPFLIQNNIDALSEFDGSLLVVGSGLDFDEYRGVWDAILNVYIRNISVLVLAPKGGSVVIPGVEGTTLPEPGGMRFLHKDVISELDKRLDRDAWPPDGKIVTSSLMLKTTRIGLFGKFVPGNQGWPWFEIDFTGKGGKIVVCGFGIIEKINDGPTPRFLLARLFEYLTGSRN